MQISECPDGWMRLIRMSRNCSSTASPRVKSRFSGTCDDSRFWNLLVLKPTFVRIVQRRCHASIESRCEEISISRAFRSPSTDENLFRLHKFCQSRRRAHIAASLAPNSEEAITHANGDLTLGRRSEGSRSQAVFSILQCKMQGCNLYSLRT